MKKITLFFLILITGSSTLIYGQITNRGEIISPEFDRFYKDFKSQQMFNEAVEENFDGSPYLNKEFEEGRIILSNGDLYNSVMLRYNIYNDQFEFSDNNKVLSLEKDPRFSCFSFNDSKFYYKKYMIKEKTWDGYLQNLIEGTYSLYMKYNMVLREGEEAKPFQEAKKPRFINQKPYYMIGSEANGIIMIKSLKDFYKAFPELEKLVKDYSGREKLKLKSEEDYIELLNLINSRED